MPQRTNYVGTQAESLARMAANHTISQPKRRPTLWHQFEGLVHDHPEAMVIGLFVLAACLVTLIGN